MEIRRIREDERRLVKLLRKYAYGSWSDEEVKEEDLSDVVASETFGLFEEGRLVSTLALLPLQQSIRGVIKRMGGISGVATYPEHRRRGHVRRLIKAAFKDMREQGMPVSMLLPFKESFYAKFGYVKANLHMRVKAPLRTLNYVMERRVEGGWEFERMRAVEAKETFMSFVMEVAPSLQGIVLVPNMTDAEWKRRNKDYLAVFVKRNGRIEAAAIYKMKGFWGPESEISVREIYWKSIEARTKLLNFFARHVDQVAHIIVDSPYGARFQHWFTDLLTPFEIKAWMPWMVRVIDVKGAIEELPAGEEGSVTVEVFDSYCDWNNGTFTIRAEEGKLQTDRGKGSPSVKMTSEAISSLVYGTHTLEEIEYEGWIRISEPGAKRMLEKWFPPIPIYNFYQY